MDGCDLRVGDFGLIRRHRLHAVGVSDCFIQRTCVRHSRFDDWPSGTAFQHTPVRCEIKIGRVPVRIVAASAVLPEDGQNVIFEIRRVGRECCGKQEREEDSVKESP